MTIYNAELHKVNIDDIASDEFFKISKKNYQNTLPDNLKISGMLEYPYLFKTGSSYGILTCHNRIKILRASGVSSLNCYVLESPDAGIFMRHTALKSYRSELGPAGKIKSLFLLDNFFKVDVSERKEFCIKVLKLPLEVVENEKYQKSVLALPDTLINYIDEKELSFKTIKDISLMPEKWVSVIDNWLKVIQVRINIFRMIVDYIFDIYRRGDNISVLEQVVFTDDKTLHDGIYRIRYPEYSKLKNKSDSIISELSGSGLTVDFPEFFDRRFLSIKLDIDKNRDCGDQLKRLQQIDIKKLKELLAFL